MKKLHLVLLLVACFVWNIMPSTCDAARQKGKVTAVVKEDTEICEALQDLLPDRGEGPCEVKGQISNLVLIQGTLPKKLEPEQSIILKVKGMGKFMTKVVFLTESDTTLKDIASAVLKEEGCIVWCSEKDGSCVLLKAEKEFLPSVGDDVSLKVKSVRKMIEGC
ncbi:MAG: hypothetical protein LWX01_08635 [Deltaproteobacteria bacterium]|nr:hypothetical protein [Deltaproteobacteria bacterium]MDL1961744.1 hypothetical protein [Deltaproteobacteria bacterium]